MRYDKTREKMEESFMTDDMVKNVKKKSICIRRQIQPTKNLKKTIQFALGDRLSRPKTSKNKKNYSKFALCRSHQLELIQ